MRLSWHYIGDRDGWEARRCCACSGRPSLVPLMFFSVQLVPHIFRNIIVAVQDMALLNKLYQCLEMVGPQLVVLLAKRFAPAVGALVAWRTRASHQSVHIPPYRSASTNLLLRVELASAIGKHSLCGRRPPFVHTSGAGRRCNDSLYIVEREIHSQPLTDAEKLRPPEQLPLDC